jgi:hypothetical protein
MVPPASDFLYVTTSAFLRRRSLYFYYTVYTQEKEAERSDFLSVKTKATD